MNNKEPLAYRMRPKTIEEFEGQEDIIGKNKLLYRMIKADKISSIIFYGPPGTGKTTLAWIISSSTNSKYEKLNAVSSGVKDIKRIAEEAQNYMLNPSGRTVLFVDEIHRFNKSQQDALLPFVEKGIIILIGATTENPYFEVNKALISRSTLFQLKPLQKSNLKSIVNKALNSKEKGYGNYNINIDDEAVEFLVDKSNGDARIVLNALELAVETAELSKDNLLKINLDTIQNCIQKRPILFDKSSDYHYDNISAFIKSMRGSDPDAAIFYLARALYAGESPEFLARRIIICASEDVGMANPSVLNVAVSAAQAVSMIGMPEARLILSQAAIMVATSPKSNACYKAILNAIDDVNKKDTGQVPMHLRNAPFSEMKDLGYGKGYKYAHDYENNIVAQDYMPEEMKGTKYYNPTKNGYEEKVSKWLEEWRKFRGGKNGT